MDAALLLFLLLKFGSIVLVLWLSGRAVQHGWVRVNYTRKLNHFVLFGWQFGLRELFSLSGLQSVRVIDGLLTVLGLTAVFVHPIRSRSAFVATMFAAYDRPEDRPWTLHWISLQLVLTLLVLLPLTAWFQQRGHLQATVILLLINAIGDGLAEPVGVRFGRHRYRVRALWGGRSYERSLEGSACVYLTAVGVLCAYAGAFERAEWIAALLLLPPGVTLAEAWAPHTLDSPLIFLSGGLILAAVFAGF